MKRLTTLLILAITVLAANANALTVAEYEKAKDNKKEWRSTQTYLRGVGSGANIYSKALEQQGQTPLFCQPEEIELKEKNYIKLIDAIMVKNEVPDIPVETILIMALMVAFPCA